MSESTPVPLARVVVIAASPRTGSNLLTSAMRATRCFGTVHEYLNRVQREMTKGSIRTVELTPRGVASRVKRRVIGDPQWRVAYHDHLRRGYLSRRLMAMSDERNPTSDTFTIKLMWGHLGGMMLPSGVDVDVWGVPVTWIHITRSDVVRQAVSWMRANQTGEWVAHRPTDRLAQYDHAAIERLVAQARRENDRWESYFAERGIDPLRIVYEDFVVDYHGTIRRLFDALGRPDLDVPPPQIEQQADELSEEWVRRYERGGGE